MLEINLWAYDGIAFLQVYYQNLVGFLWGSSPCGLPHVMLVADTRCKGQTCGKASSSAGRSEAQHF